MIFMIYPLCLILESFKLKLSPNKHKGNSVKEIILIYLPFMVLHGLLNEILSCMFLLQVNIKNWRFI